VPIRGIAAALRFAPEDIKHMLYTKDYFQPHNDDEIFDLIDRTVLGTLITPHENGVAISHPVFMIDRQNRRLISHIAMNNDHGQYLRAGLPAVAILMDQGSYISSSWYPNYPQRDSAPTWSFMVAHIHGKPEIMSDAETVQHLQDLVTYMERGRDKAWQMKELGPGGMGRRLPNILGYTMPIDKMEVKFKLGQDERRGDMKAATEQLDKNGQQILADRMRDYCKL
jgi:transcriptional regulator